MGRTRPANLEVDYYGAFPKAMRALGYIDGRNVHYEWRYADGKMEALPKLAAELVALKVDLIVTAGTAPARAATRATKSIPIVMASVGDVLIGGTVTSLARPGGNATGNTNLAVGASQKQLELLAKTAPKVSTIAVLLNPGNPASQAVLEDLHAVA